MQMRTRLCGMSAVSLMLVGRFVVSAAAIPRVFSTYLKESSSITQIAVDAAGNLYVLGYGESPIPSHGVDLFIAKFDPNATTVEYFVYLGGTSTDVGEALAVDAAGNAYIAGTTASSDFPTLPKTTVPVPSAPGATLPFVAKLDPGGNVLYSTLFAGPAVAVPSAMVVDPAGEPILTGYTSDKTFPTTGSYGSLASGPEPFITKLAANGSTILFSLIGVGGTAIGLDSLNNVFVSGTTPALGYPTTAGAFQTTFVPSQVCALPPCQIEFPAGEQYITKVAPDGGKLVYSTFVTGSNGSTNGGLVVDSEGDAFVTGTTASGDYPYTVASSSAGRPDTFVTKLDPSGSKVLLSVREGGSAIALEADGNIVITGNYVMIAPPQLPGQGVANPPPPEASGAPDQCLSNGSTILSSAYAMLLNGRDGSLLESAVMGGTEFSDVVLALGPQGRIYLAGETAMPDVPLTPGVPYSPAASERTASGVFITAFDPSLPSPPVQLSCAVDPATMALVGPLAPGQLLSLFGTDMGPALPLTGLNSNARTVPVSLGGVNVSFDGTPAPLLYVSANQINLQVPFEIMNSSSTLMQVQFNGAVVATRLFAVTPRNPSLFITPGTQLQQCAHTGSSDLFSVVATLANGSAASCANLPAPGSEVAVFVNGLGVDALNRVTGSITMSSPPSIDVPFDVESTSGSLQGDALTDMPNAISGLGRVNLRVPSPAPTLVDLSIRINGEDASPFTYHLGNVLQMPAVLWINPSK